MLRRPDREIPQALLHHTGIEILRQRMAAALLRRGVTIDNAGVAVRIEEPDHLITNALDRRGIRQSIKEVDKPRQHFLLSPQPFRRIGRILTIFRYLRSVRVGNRVRLRCRDGHPAVPFREMRLGEGKMRTPGFLMQ